MTITKVLCPLLRSRQTLLECKAFTSIICGRQKSTKTNAIIKSARREVDTNVKPLGEKVRETTKTVSYLGIILLGVGVTGTLFYAVFNELFSSKSSNSIYTKAVKRCMSDTRVEDKLGLPITAYGEETRRGRRQHVSHVKYEHNGRKHIRMRFYLKGSFNKGTVHLEMAENDSGNFEYRYLFVEINDLLQTTIVLEDNRYTQPSSSLQTSPSFEF